MDGDEKAKEREQRIVYTVLESGKGILDDAVKFANFYTVFCK